MSWVSFVVVLLFLIESYPRLHDVTVCFYMCLPSFRHSWYAPRGTWTLAKCCWLTGYQTTQKNRTKIIAGKGLRRHKVDISHG